MNFQLIKLKRFWTIISIICFAFIIGGCGYDDSIMVVRNGSFVGYPNIPIGKAFDQYYSSRSWDSTKEKSGDSDSKKYTVKFEGKFKFKGKTSKAVIYFVANPETEYFKLSGMKINDKSIPPLLQALFLKDVMESYRDE